MAAHRDPVPPAGNMFGDVAYAGDCSQGSTWHRPQGTDKGLKVKNSLTSHLADNRLDSFVPGSGNKVLWYTCGPTVYDSCHMGHARAYLTFDILRRITEDYFKYDVLYHVNITDVDDKIIKAARRNHLVGEFRKGVSLEDALAKVQAGMEVLRTALEKKESELAVPLPADAISRDQKQREDDLTGLKLKKTQYTEAAEKVTKATEAKDIDALFVAGRAALQEILDKEQGHTVSDHSIFNAHARKYENEFFEDMERLGVKQPDVLTRVTEYVPKIVDFIKTIEDKGLAYASNGSVYLSIDDFKKAGHTYRKLVPGKDTSDADMAEGEGALGTNEKDEKRNKNDFALWKASKPGEPEWDSPWGKGRPGWHIECSVVASDVLGPVMDVHAGGQDLKFPHHDNELAQSEACFGHTQWVNYFYHAGHLDIEGLKMSKSLKNFITIRQALESTSPRVIRLLFLLQPWHKKMNYSDQAIETAATKEKSFREFFHKVKSHLRSDWASKAVGLENGGKDRALLELLFKTQEEVDKAFKNNFDTPAALASMERIVTEFNKYESDVSVVAVHVVLKIATYITSILRVLGLCSGTDEIGFGSAEGGESREQALRPVLDEFVKFRKDIRVAARAKDTSAIKSQVMSLSDGVRASLPKLGIAVEDMGDESTWKLDDPAVLMAELAAKDAAQKAQEAKKLKGKFDKLRKDFVKAEKVFALGAPETMFKNQAKYQGFEFDPVGLPVRNTDGEELPKSASKSIAKEKTTQEKDWKGLVDKSEGNTEAHVQKLGQDVADLKQQLLELGVSPDDLK